MMALGAKAWATKNADDDARVHGSAYCAHPQHVPFCVVEGATPLRLRCLHPLKIAKFYFNQLFVLGFFDGSH